MGGVQHPSDELLSAFSDGETSQPEAEAVGGHLSSCARCSSYVLQFRRLDAALTSETALPCAAVRPLLSAELDRELDSAVAPVVRQHLAGCVECRALGASWAALDDALQALPLGRPSRRVDDAIAALVRRRVGRPVPASLADAAFRVAVAAVVLVALLTTAVVVPPASNDTATVPAPNGALVASAQMVVLDARTNSLYVLRPAEAVVLVRDAATDEQLGRIPVGGTPTALALDASRSSIYVLDASNKSIIQIDTTTRTVVANSALTLAGAPVSLQAHDGKLLVASSGDSSSSAQIAVVDTSSPTLRVESVKSIDVSPTLVVVDPMVDRTFVLGKDATLVLDTASLARVATLPGGGVGAASDGRGVTAILTSANGRGRVAFYGATADGIDLPGAPLAIAAGGNAGFAALVDAGNGKGRVVQFDTNGIFRSTDVGASARQIAYDASADRYVLVGAAGDVVLSLTSSLAVIPATPSPSRAATPTATSSTSPSASPAPSGAPGPSTQPAAQPSVAPPVAAARALWSTTYYLELKDWQPERIVSLGNVAWFTDRGAIATLDLATGAVKKLAQLPRGESVGFIAVGSGVLYVIGDESADLHLVDLTTGKLDNVALPYGSVTGLATTPDGHAWITSSSTGSLMEFDPGPRSFRLVQTPIARSLSAVSADTGGRVWYAYRSEAGVRLGSYDRFARRVLEYDIPGLLAIDNVFADRTGAVWLSSRDGRWVAVRGGVVTASLAGAAVDIQRFALGMDGAAWLLRTSAAGTRLGPAGARLELSLPAGVRDLAGDDKGSIWAADTLEGGFYIFANPVTSP